MGGGAFDSLLASLIGISIDRKRKMNHRRYLWSLLTLALLLRVGFGLTQSDLTNASDEVHWDRLGQGYVALGVLHPDTGMYRPPLYGLFLAGMYHTFGHTLCPRENCPGPHGRTHMLSHLSSGP